MQDSTTVYGVSVDSRSRETHESDAAYTVSLNRTLQRVRAVQLASFQFQDARPVVDVESVVRFSEPLTIAPDTYLRFEETTSSGTRRRVSVLLPPSRNAITSMSGNVVTTMHDTGLAFGVKYYNSAGLPPVRVVGADFPPDLAAFVTPSFPRTVGPVLTSSTVDAPYTETTASTFRYTSPYLTELSGGVGDPVLRHYSAGVYTSYVAAPKPTLVELVALLNAATGDLTMRVDIEGVNVSGATNASPIVVTTSTPHGVVTGDEVVVSGVNGNAGANGTWLCRVLTSTTFELVGSGGTGVYTGGGVMSSPQKLNGSGIVFEVGRGGRVRVVCASSEQRRRVRLVGSLAVLLGFGHDVTLPAESGAPAVGITTVPLRAGVVYTATELASTTMSRVNATGVLSVPRRNRTLYFIMPDGTPSSVLLDYGYYTGLQLAAYLTAVLSPSPYNLSVTYDGDTGTFTFSHLVGFAFGLDFQTTSTTLSDCLGFEREVYTGASTYTSVRHVGDGTHENEYVVTADEATSRFTFRTTRATSLYTVSGTSLGGVGGAWNPLLVSTSEPFAHRFGAGDILVGVRPTLSSTQDGAAAITSGTATSPISITTLGSHGLTTGDTVTIEDVRGLMGANGTWVVTVTGLTTFTLNGSTGSSSYSAGTGVWYTTTSFVTGSQKPSATYTVVVKEAWDASTGTPLLTLEPTASLFSTQDAGTVSRQPLGTPSPSNGLIHLVSDRRNVFTLHFDGREGDASSFGFSTRTATPAVATSVTGSYTSPTSYNLLPPDYIVVVLRACGSNDIHTHTFDATRPFPIFAKLLITFPFINITDEMVYTTFSAHENVNRVFVEFQHPDGTRVNFNGRPHTFTLLFTVEQNKVESVCI